MIDEFSDGPFEPCNDKYGSMYTGTYSVSPIKLTDSIMQPQTLILTKTLALTVTLTLNRFTAFSKECRLIRLDVYIVMGMVRKLLLVGIVQL